MQTSKEFFNKVAYRWDEICNHNTDKIKKIMEYSSIKRENKVLDVGAGTGVLIPYIYSIIGDKGHITAVDLSENMLRIAKSKYNYENLKYLVGDIHNMKLEANFYDCIFCYSVFPHLYNKEKAIINMSKFLKQKGKIVICHSQSREQINDLHKKASKEISEASLPEMKVIKKYLINAKFNLIKEIDNDKMFIIIGAKE